LLEFNLTLEEKIEERTHALSEANQLFEDFTMTDVLTGLPNRRHAKARLTQTWTNSLQDASVVVMYHD
jgi:hemerythrin